LWFQAKFRLLFPIFLKNVIAILLWIAVKLCNSFGKCVHFNNTFSSDP
jgi:hypothetical protein